MKIFISYNHKDKNIADDIKTYLSKEGFNIIIDSENMQAGAIISDFIAQSIQNTDATLSIVSENSLLSAWVAMETMNTIQNKNKLFIPCYITKNFMEPDFHKVSKPKIVEQIDEKTKIMTDRFADQDGIEDCADEYTRLIDLKNNLSKIIGELKKRLCIDISGGNILSGMVKISEQLKKL